MALSLACNAMLCCSTMLLGERSIALQREGQNWTNIQLAKSDLFCEFLKEFCVKHLEWPEEYTRDKVMWSLFHHGSTVQQRLLFK